MSSRSGTSSFTRRQWLGFFFGLITFSVLLICPLSAEGLTPEGKKMAAIAILMAIWWIGEVVPIAVTALLPLVFYPLTGIMASKTVAPHYANHLIFLFLGGFLIALAMEKWQLHRRLALHIIRLFGTKPSNIVLGFMVATAFLSMWISNTATTLMMLPIAIAVVTHFARQHEMHCEQNAPMDTRVFETFGVALMLGIAYAASIGGIGTLIGTPPNIIFAGFVSRLFPSAPEIGFLQWMLVGIPLVIVFLPLAWFLVCHVNMPHSIDLVTMKDGDDIVSSELERLGPMSCEEKVVLIVFSCTALLWIFRAPISFGPLMTIPGWSQLFPWADHLHDATVAMSMGLLLFVIPSSRLTRATHHDEHLDFILDWKTVQLGVPWGILVLFGGGFALAAGFQETGLDKWIGQQLTAASVLPLIFLVLIVSLVITFLTEVTSNTAVITMMLPILASIAVSLRIHPFFLMIPATLSASCAFMLPVATPPNAIVFGPGWLTIPRMAKTGLVFNLLGAIIITAIVYTIAAFVFGMWSELPSWVTL